MCLRRLRLLALALAPVLLGWPSAMNATDVPSGSHARPKATRSMKVRPATDEEALQPGFRDFQRALDAVKRKHFDAAVDLYETSAAWGYKPAHYRLAMLYCIGEGIAVDKPRALAWAALAAERGDEDYADARELIYSELSADEFAQANAIWRGLKRTYGDAVALDRAKHRLAELQEIAAAPRIGTMAASTVDARGDDVARNPTTVDIGESVSAAKPAIPDAAPYGSDARQADAAPSSDSIDVSVYGGGDAD
jgi:hypothetical protein